MIGRLLVATDRSLVTASVSVSAGLRSGVLTNGQFFSMSNHLLKYTAQPLPVCAQRHCHVNSSLPHCCINWSHDHHIHAYPSATHRHSSSASSPPGKEPGWLKQQWTKLKVTMRAFATGTKALYRDVMKMREIRSRHGVRNIVLGHPPLDPKTGQADFPLTREELLFTVKTRQDLMKMLPTVILFCIPFIGYFVPVIAFMYPHRFLSHHFLTEEKKFDLMMSSHETVLAKIKNLSDALKEQRGHTDQLNFLCEVGDMFSSGQVKDEVTVAAKGSAVVMNVNKKNMQALVDVWKVRSLVPFPPQRGRLMKKMRYIYTSDWLMKLEGGVNTISAEALAEVCCERRLDVNFKSEEDMRKKLDVWIKITTSFDKCPEFLLAHLPTAQYL